MLLIYFSRETGFSLIKQVVITMWRYSHSTQDSLVVHEPLMVAAGSLNSQSCHLVLATGPFIFSKIHRELVKHWRGWDSRYLPIWMMEQELSRTSRKFERHQSLYGKTSSLVDFFLMTAKASGTRLSPASFSVLYLFFAQEHSMYPQGESKHSSRCCTVQ